MSKYTPIIGIAEWPSVPGHAGSTDIWSGWRKSIAKSKTSEYWLVKKKGLFQKWEWRPRHGMFVRLMEVGEEK